MTDSSDDDKPARNPDRPDAGADDEAALRYQRLTQLRDEALAARDKGAPGEQDDEDAELQAFLDDLAEKKNSRKTQLSLVKAFFADPLRFSAGLDNDPEITSGEELLQHRSLLEDQVDLLTTILEAAKTELEQLDKALEDSDRETPGAP